MTVPRLLEISEYWNVVPPLHEAFASFIGALNKNGRTVAPAPGAAPVADAEMNGALLQDLIAMGFQIPVGILTEPPGPPPTATDVRPTD